MGLINYLISIKGQKNLTTNNISDYREGGGQGEREGRERGEREREGERVT